MKDEFNFWKDLKRPILALAPMVGISNSAFRMICRDFGADVVYSEMISADAIVHRARKALDMLRHDPSEYPYVVQLMGKDPAALVEAAQYAEKYGASGIDLNFGCPANKITKNMCGVMLMRDPVLSRTLIEATIDSVSIPVSVKVRTSIRNESKHESITILDFLDYMQGLDIAAIMVHGRSFEDPFQGAINEHIIAEVKEKFVNGPVLVNGGITSIESAKEILQRTNADGIGFARSAIGHPWIFSQVREYLEQGEYKETDWERVKTVLIQHAELFEKVRGSAPFQEIRKHLTHYVRGHEHAARIRTLLTQTDSVEEIKKILICY